MKLCNNARLLFCCAFLMPVACSSPAENQNGRSDPTVETNTLACAAKDGDETAVVCDVAVSNVQVSQHALAFTINAYVWNLLPKVCGGYDQNPLLADPQGFNGKVEAELSATVDQSGTGWTVESVACRIPN